MSTNATTATLGGAKVGSGPAAPARRHARGWEWWVLAGMGIVALLVLIAGSLGIVVVAAERASFLSPPTHSHYFPSWLAGPLGGAWPQFTDHRNNLKYFFTFSVAGMYVAYLFALVCVPRLRARWAIGAIVIVHVLLFLSPPLSLTDVFNYINYGRMQIVHGLNPYTSIPVVEPHSDPSFDLSNWHHLLSPYGPLFTMFTFLLVPFGVAASFWTLKAVLLAFSLGTIALVWRCAVLLGRDPLRAIVFVGLNPVVLVWGLGGDHNDFMMVFFVMLAVYLVLRARAGRTGVPEQATSAAAQAPMLGNGARFLPALYPANGNGAAAPGAHSPSASVAHSPGSVERAPSPASVARAVSPASVLRAPSRSSGGRRLLEGVVRRLVIPPPATPASPAGDAHVPSRNGARRRLPGVVRGLVTRPPATTVGPASGAHSPSPNGARNLLPGVVRWLRTPPSATPASPPSATGPPSTTGPQSTTSSALATSLPSATSPAVGTGDAETATRPVTAPHGDGASAEHFKLAPRRSGPRQRILEWAQANLLTAETAAGAALVTAVALKASAGILLPVLLMASRRRLATLTGMALTALVLGSASLIAFGPHVPDLATQGRMVTAMSLPNLLGLALGQGGETSSMKTILELALIAAVLAAAAYAWRKRDPISSAGWATVALLVILSWVLPWYVLWLLPFAALARSGALRGVALTMGVYLILAWVPLMPDIIHSVHFKPSTTPLGQAHQRTAKDLLK